MNRKRCGWSDKLVEHVEGLLSSAETDALKRHLAECPDCSRDVIEIRSILMFARQQEVPSPPPEMETRLWNGLTEALARRRETDRPLAPPWWDVRPHIHDLVGAMRGRRLALAGAALTALLLALWMGGPILREPAPPLAPSAEVALVLEMLREEESTMTGSTTSSDILPPSETPGGTEHPREELSLTKVPETFADDLLALEGYLAEEIGVELLLESLSAEEEERLTRFLQVEFGIDPPADEPAPGGEESSHLGPSWWLYSSTPDWEEV